MRARFAVNPEQYRRVAYASLVALSLIVLTGAAVRLTDSGLGCSDWPKCSSGQALPSLSGHPLIEFGNRMMLFVIGPITAAAFILAWTRRPYRRDLMWISAMLPLGVIAQAVLGGVTVKQKLAPGWVISHFLLSMLVLVPAFALAWRSRFEPGSRPRSTDRLSVWTVRALAPLGALTIVAGTFATGAGPHSGGSSGQHIHRLHFKGADTLNWVIHRHATIAALFGVAVIGAWFLRRRRGAAQEALEALTVLGVLLAAQGLVGSVQYELKLPSDMVWVHVTLATLTWLALLWAVAVEGRLVPRMARVPAAPERSSSEMVPRSAEPVRR